jgi:hypothetical protein
MSEETSAVVKATMREIRRKTRKKYSAEEKVRIVLEGLRGEWMVQALGLKRKSMPSHPTYRRALAEIIDVQEFEAQIREYHR